MPTIKTQDQDSVRALSTSLSADGGAAGLAVVWSGGDVGGLVEESASGDEAQGIGGGGEGQAGGLGELLGGGRRGGGGEAACTAAVRAVSRGARAV